MKKILLTILLSIFVVSLAGCGGKDSSDDKKGDDKEPITDSQDNDDKDNKELDVVTFVLPRDIEVLDDAHVVCADVMGYFAEEGIKVEFEKSSGTSDMTMISMGQGDICLPDSMVYLIGQDSEIPLMAIYQQDVLACNVIAVKDDSDIKTFEDLKGKSIALGDAAWSVCVDPMLASVGLDPKTDVEYIVAGENRAQMVNEGQVDAVFTWEKGYQLWNAQGMNFRAMPASDVLAIPGNPLVTSVENFENNKDVLTRFLRGFAKGQYFVTLNPEAAAEITLERFPSITVDFEDAVEVMKAGALIMNDEGTEEYGYGYCEPSRWDESISLAKELGIIKGEFGSSDIMSNDLIEEANNFDHDAVKTDAEGYELKNK